MRNSLAAVGSVSTAAIVANQFGLFSSSSSEAPSTNLVSQNSNNPKPTSVVNSAPKRHDDTWFQRTLNSRPNWKAISEWLKKNQAGTWDVQIKKHESAPEHFSDSRIKDSDLSGLHNHLKNQKDLLVSLSSETRTTFVFEKTHETWKHTWKKEHIDAWVDKTSEKKSNLGNLSNLSSQDLESLYTFLKDKTTELFKDLQGATEDNKKTMLFEKDGWLKKNDGGNNQFTIKSDKEETLDEIDETKLMGLLGYLKEEKDTLLKLIKDPAHLTFEKNGSWNVIHSKTTIENWVYKTSFGKATLKLWKNDSEEQLSSLAGKEQELKELFEVLKGKKSLFNDNLESYDTTNKKTIVFEKYKESWKHIKEAIKELIDDSEWKEELIKIGNDSKALIKDTNDDKLTGLLKHLKDNEDDYENSLDENAGKGLILEKEANNQWKLVKKLGEGNEE